MDFSLLFFSPKASGRKCKTCLPSVASTNLYLHCDWILCVITHDSDTSGGVDKGNYHEPPQGISTSMTGGCLCACVHVCAFDGQITIRSSVVPQNTAAQTSCSNTDKKAALKKCSYYTIRQEQYTAVGKLHATIYSILIGKVNRGQAA